jgi:hypothetical protein
VEELREREAGLAAQLAAAADELALRQEGAARQVGGWVNGGGVLGLERLQECAGVQ